jgi:N-ethylmaleimide reductase
MNLQPVLEPVDLGGIKLRNRVVMAPMTRSRATNPENKPTEIHATYYNQRASAGLIITEGAQISKKAVGYINTPGIYSNEQINAWKEVTKSVHEEGGKIFIQLWHVGRISHPDFHNGELPLAPSAINPLAKSFTPKGFKDTVAPKEMTLEEIQQTVNDFKQAAKNAMEAGFDGVEIHASNGYLLHQFFSRTSNVRADEYGGSIANRARILFDIIDAIKTYVPENQIGVRLNPSLHGVFGMTMDEESIPTFDYIIERLNEYNLAYLHLSEPFTDVSNLDFAETDIAGRYRPVYKGTLIINAGFDQDKANAYILEGKADAVAFGKPFISNPDLVDRFRENVPLAEWDDATFYTGGEKGYTDYPMLTQKNNK